MDKEYFASALAEAVGTEKGLVEAEHRLMNDWPLEVGMKRQLQEIHDEDEAHLHKLEKALEDIGPSVDAEAKIERGRRLCHDLLQMSGDEPIDVLKATILVKYKAVDSAELFYNLCDDIGKSEMCDVFEEALEDDEDHLDYLREQAILMARERITGISATE